MILIPDDPIIASALRTGYPPWNQPRDEDGWDDDDDFEGDGDVYYGNETGDF